ncbi:putative leader peptide [Pseudonocardia sediminis]|uniref:putative leader peptide n=1 Tax=Pseudonocardia sediminis TaxID=1397368 RepID=UPI003BF8C5DF
MTGRRPSRDPGGTGNVSGPRDPVPTSRDGVTRIPRADLLIRAGAGYRREVIGSALLTTRGHIDLARVASALCRP